MKYFIDTQNLSTYINQHDLPCLENWINSNLLQFVQHECNSTSQLRSNIVSVWQKFAKDKETNRSLNENLLNDIFLMNTQTSASQRESIMLWFYSLCEKNDVEDVWKKVQGDVENLQKMKTKNPACMLDLMAVRLLHKFNDLNKDEFVALKLAMSRIVDFLNDDILDVFKNYVDPFFWEVIKVDEDAAAVSATAATEEEEALVKSVFDPVIKKSNEQGVEEAQILIAEKKIGLLKENKRHSLEYNLVLAADFIFNNIEDWGSSEVTEAQVVANISVILSNIFKNTKLKVVM
ncbi:hypothetical protein EDC96DRAFT_28652 [Choanephora cucurbitarum]|nr:hypothetical protein EDC96DRAFT_28652 [Choanephora cucurbitarum]